MSDTDKIVEGEKRVEKKTEELIYKFHAHYQSYIEQHPEDKGSAKNNFTFQAPMHPA